MAWEYSEKTKQLFMDAIHGKPGTHLGEIENPDGVGVHGSISCGDAMKFTFRVAKNEEDPTKDIITEARYLTFGCTSAIAASEALCIILESRKCTPIEALTISNQDIVDFLEGLPEQKIHCSVMGEEALNAAVLDWAKKRGVSLTELGIDVKQHEEEEEGRLVCKCFSLSEPYIKRKIRELNLHTIPEITDAIKAGGACTNCQHAPGGLQDLLDEVWGTGKREQNAGQNFGKNSLELPILGESGSGSPGEVTRSSSDFPAGEMSPYQFSKKVETVLETLIRPALLRDGGDISIMDIKGKIIYVRLSGACANCAGANVTLKGHVEKILKDHVDNAIRVIQV
ncbi:MAG: iron-sulfur cluster assembly scaffold protein [Planctomycetia bacterium]|nr:iron-sulfur cluster assembly scaffold protein [Planctomycetia bacterium]